MKQISYFFTRLGIRLFLGKLSVFYPALKCYKIH
jgi:hypothetical protein